MRVIPVIDLRNGQVVRAVAGRRSEYRPIGEACDIADWLVRQFYFRTVYVADLDAIIENRANRPCWRKIAEAGLNLWLDAGAGTVADVTSVARDLEKLTTNPTIIVGLESLHSLGFVEEIVQLVSPSKLIFSLDLKNGQLITLFDPGSREPIQIVHEVATAGMKRFVVLDLADVGVAGGTRTLALCRQIRAEFPDVELTAGGGVRGLDDLRALADAGCDAALVASALHDGRLTPEDVREAESWSR